MTVHDEPCMCGTPFTCVADEHDRTVYESHEWTGGGDEDRCARCFTAWDGADYACGDGPPLYAAGRPVICAADFRAVPGGIA